MANTFEKYLPGSPADGHDGQFLGRWFCLEVDGTVIGTFQTCSGLSLELEVKELIQNNKDGKQIVMKVPGAPKFNEITLKHALDNNWALYNWYMQVEKGGIKDARKGASVIVYQRDNTVVERWDFEKCWPSSWKTSDLDAGSDEVMTEEVTIQHEGVTRKPS